MPDDTEERISQLERYFFDGRKHLQELQGDRPYGSGLTQSEVQKQRLQRRFADPNAGGYGPEDFRQLIAEFRKSGFALGTAAMGRLVAVPKRERDRLIKRAIAGRWTLEKITLEIRKLGPTKRIAGGKPVNAPTSREDAADRLLFALPSWLATLDAIAPETGTPPVKLPAAVVEQIRLARETLARLMTLAEKLK